MHPAPFPPSRLPCARRLALLLVRAFRLGIDALLEDRRGFEDHDAPRRNRHFLAGLGIASDPLSLLAHHERSERRKLHCLAALQAVGDLLEHQLDQHSGFGARQPDFLVDRLAKIRACHRLPSHRPAPLVRGKSILMNYRRYSHAWSMARARISLTSAAASRPR